MDLDNQHDDETYFSNSTSRPDDNSDDTKEDMVNTNEKEKDSFEKDFVACSQEVQIQRPKFRNRKELFRINQDDVESNKIKEKLRSNFLECVDEPEFNQLFPNEPDDSRTSIDNDSADLELNKCSKRNKFLDTENESRSEEDSDEYCGSSTYNEYKEIERKKQEREALDKTIIVKHSKVRNKFLDESSEYEYDDNEVFKINENIKRKHCLSRKEKAKSNFDLFNKIIDLNNTRMNINKEHKYIIKYPSKDDCMNKNKKMKILSIIQGKTDEKETMYKCKESKFLDHDEEYNQTHILSKKRDMFKDDPKKVKGMLNP